MKFKNYNKRSLNEGKVVANLSKDLERKILSNATVKKFDIVKYVDENNEEREVSIEIDFGSNVKIISQYDPRYDRENLNLFIEIPKHCIGGLFNDTVEVYEEVTYKTQNILDAVKKATDVLDDLSEYSFSDIAIVR